MKLKSITGKARLGAFTLIEVLLVIVIIMLLAGAIVAFVIPQQEGAEKNTTRMLVNNVKGSLDNYRLNIGHYPTEEEGGLLGLVQKPEFENENLALSGRGHTSKSALRSGTPGPTRWFTSRPIRSSCRPAIRRTGFTPKARTGWRGRRTILATRKPRRKQTVWRN